MDEIGLFPLGMVLLPTERVPLHIFEERYKELIDECIELEQEFGLVLQDDDGIREVGTRAAVVAVLERFDDGRLNVARSAPPTSSRSTTSSRTRTRARSARRSRTSAAWPSWPGPTRRTSTPSPTRRRSSWRPASSSSRS
jgi:hypothetical protein